MPEETPEVPKKHRGWPKGKPRAPRIVSEPEPEAPIHVLVTRKGMPPFNFGCAEHFTENGFHVFIYPSRRDPYRQTRREIAISEVIDIEITEARRQVAVQIPSQYRFEATAPFEEDARPPAPKGPIIHSVKKHAAGILSQLETSSGPIKMDAPPGISFGGHDG